MYLLELLRKEVKDTEAERLIDELEKRLEQIIVDRKLESRRSDPPSLFNYPGGHSPS